MNLNNTSDAALHGRTVMPNSHGMKKMDKTETSVSTSVQSKGPENAPSITAGSESEDGQAKGVLRLLQEGHFKGVAAVRLRINFHEQLSAQQSASQLNGAKEALGALIEKISDIASGVSGEDVSELGDAIEDLKAVLADYLATADSADSLVQGVQFAFDSFNETLGIFRGESAAGGIAAEGGDAVTSLSQAGFDQSLPMPSPVETVAMKLELSLATFRSTMGDMKAATDSASIAEPKGDGVAFDKFMEIYRGMQEGDVESATEATRAGEPSIDEVA